MGRRGYIALTGLSVLLWSWIAYFNISRVMQSATPLDDVLLAPSIVLPLALVPMSVMRLLKFVTAERAENVLNPHLVVSVSQPAIARAATALMALIFLVSGLGSFWARSPISDVATPLFLSILYAVAGVMLAATALFSPRLRIRLSPDGFEYSQMKPGRVSSQDITDVKLHTLLFNSRIVLTLKGTTEFRAANPFARWRKVEKVLVYPLTLGIEPEMLKQGIDLRRNVFTF